MPLYQALDVARKQGLDLLEVAPTAVPPVCRIVDFGKYKYEQAKKDKEARKGQKIMTIREIRLRPKIGDHDFEAKAKSATKLLKDGSKVKVSVMFRGREATHPELGWKLIQRMAESLKEVSVVDKQASMENARILSIVLSPAPTKAKPKEEVKEKELVKVGTAKEAVREKEAVKES